MGEPRPDIVLIVVHDLGRHLGCYGVPTVRSPHCDELAAQGVRFSDCFAVAPQCSPSRAGLFTGRYPHENGMLGLAHDPHSWDIHRDEIHLADRLRSSGYRTGLIGFQHETRRPGEMGFDDCDYRWHDSCENIGRDAAEYIRRQSSGDRPYYLQVGIIEPHRHFDMYGGVPDDTLGVWIPPYLMDELSATEDFAGFQGAIRKMDAGIGMITGAVEASGRGENTLVVFTTDHGIPFPRAKCSLYDPGLEIALIARWPAGGWTGGKVVDGLVSNIDLLPTLLHAANIDIPAEVSGRRIVDLTPTRNAIFGEMTYHGYYDPIRCVRDQKHKLIANFSSALSIQDPSQSWRPLTTPLPPGITASTRPDFEFYDLETDPTELVNLYESGAMEEERNQHMRTLAGWCLDTGDRLLVEPAGNPQHQRVANTLRSAGG